MSTKNSFVRKILFSNAATAHPEKAKAMKVALATALVIFAVFLFIRCFLS